jgi:hypothetical protein
MFREINDQGREAGNGSGEDNKAIDNLKTIILEIQVLRDDGKLTDDQAALLEQIVRAVWR